MNSRRGEGNPFFGRRHTPEWKAAQSARQSTWTPEDLATLRRWYMERENAPLHLDELAKLLGRRKTNLSRIAKQLGLSNHRRKTGRKPRAKYPDEASRRAAVGAASRERIATNGHPRGMLGKRQKPEVIAKATAAATEWHRHATPEQRETVIEKTQQTLMERYGTLAPGNDASRNPYSRCNYGRRDDLGGQFFRSRWEANYARYLNFLIAQGQIAGWEYEADTFWFEDIRRGVRSYKPDFKVTETTGAIHYVEVKGWMDPKSVTKLKRMKKYHPNVDLRLVDERAYRELAKYFAGAIPGWESDSRGRQ